MKRFTLLKKIGIASTSALAICPIVLTATSCAPTSFLTEVYNFNALCDSEGETLDTKLVNLSFEKLLYGSKHLSNGNYVMFVGSNMFNETCKFFTMDEHGRDRSLWFTDPYLSDSVLYNGAIAAKTDPEQTAGLLDFNIYNAIEFFDNVLHDKKGHIYYYSEDGKQKKENIGPFDTWKDQASINSTVAYNRDVEGYDWDEDSVEIGDYIRTDTYARQYRQLCKLGKILYPASEEEGKERKTFNTDDDNTTSLVVIFRKGKLQTIEDLPADPDSFAKLLTDYLTKDEPEPEPPEPDPEEWR